MEGIFFSTSLLSQPIRSVQAVAIQAGEEVAFDFPIFFM